jgi:microfibrillar-associated protein 1
MRANARARAAEGGEEVVEVAELPLEDEDEGAAGSESSWEYESESEGEDDRKLVKPVFVTKVGRATMEERARIDAEYAAEEVSKKKRTESRKLETRQMVAEELVREQQQVVARTQRATREDTDSEGNEEEEYDRWRLRELKRIKRDKEERQVHEREKLEVERRRGMTDSQVVAEDQQMGKGKKTRAQMVFMQKYHHKGAFFMENDEANLHKESLYNRDTNEALESDRNTARQAQGGPYDGSKVFEVRRGQFGKMGQTKWTHLTNEDTTKLDSPWMQDDQIRRKFIGKSGGMAK